MLQHGLFNDCDSYEHNVYTGVVPIESDHTIVWGKIYEDYFKHIGIPEKKIHIRSERLLFIHLIWIKRFINLINNTTGTKNIEAKFRRFILLVKFINNLILN